MLRLPSGLYNTLRFVSIVVVFAGIGTGCKTTSTSGLQTAEDNLDIPGACALYVANRPDGPLQRSACADNFASSPNFNRLISNKTSCQLDYEENFFNQVDRSMFKKMVFYPSASGCADRQVEIAVGRDEADATAHTGKPGSTDQGGSCSDFTGHYVGSCTGEEADSSGENDFQLAQEGCQVLKLSDTEALPLDGKSHSGEGFKYMATFDRNLYPAGDHIRIELVSGAAGVSSKILWLLEDESGVKTIKRKMTRTFSGETEELASCSFNQAP